MRKTVTSGGQPASVLLNLRPARILDSGAARGKPYRQLTDHMPTTTQDSLILEKTRELCQTILEHPDFKAFRIQIDTFLNDDNAKDQYQSLIEKGEMLNHKQQQGVNLSPSEIADYEKHRDSVVANPVAKGFIEAQQEMHKVQESVSQYVSKTFELGRLPTEEDFGGGSCGSGCGCH